MSELTKSTISTLSSLLAKKEVSSRELVSAYLSAIEAKQDLNCFVFIDAEKALAAADSADAERAAGAEGTLLGVPLALKDIIITDDLPTTCASKILKDFVAPYDSTVASRLRAAGAVFLGKTNMDEFAMGSSNENSAYGPVKNPWNTDCVAGGSSGGSAAAVAASIAPGSFGTDTGGSIRQPAAFCSVVGIKPTYGRVSRYGIVAFASSLDQVGPFARTVEDCAVLLETICGWDSNDSTSMDIEVPSFHTNLTSDVAGLRIGVPKEYFVDGMQPEVEAAVKDALAHFESLGAEIVDISLPHTEAAVSTYYILAPAEASSNLSRYDGIRYGHRAEGTEDLYDLYCRTRAEGFGPEVKRRIMIGTYVLSAGYYDAFYRRAQKVRTLIKQDFTTAFENHCDVIVCPTTPSTAFKIGEKTSDPLAMYLNDIFTIPVNLAGLPGMSIPCGFDESSLPIGLQLIGKPWDEQTVLNLAFAYEQSTEWHTLHAGAQ